MNNTISIAIGGTVVALVVLLLAPVSAFAAPADNAFLGGGNALARATSGQSQGLAHASSTSDLLARLTFTSTRGGRPAEVPPAQDEEGTDEGTGQGDPGTQSLPEEANENADNHTNGGASGGNGGNGGNAGTAGIVRAGSVVSNADAVNVLNTILVRISAR